MRISIRRTWNWEGPKLLATIGASTFQVQRPRILFWGPVWRLRWLDGQPLEFLYPKMSSNVAEWKFQLGQRTICTGRLETHFWPWCSKGLVWECGAVEIVLARCRSCFSNALRTNDGTLLAAWRHTGYHFNGVIRSRLENELAAAVLAIMITMNVANEWDA